MSTFTPSIGVRFERDEAHDVFICFPCGVLRRPADCDILYEAFSDFFAKVGRRIDVVSVFDMLTVELPASDHFQERRIEIARQFFRYIRLVHATPEVAAILARRQKLGPQYSRFTRDIAEAVRSIVTERAAAATENIGDATVR